MSKIVISILITISIVGGLNYKEASSDLMTLNNQNEIEAIQAFKQQDNSQLTKGQEKKDTEQKGTTTVKKEQEKKKNISEENIVIIGDSRTVALKEIIGKNYKFICENGMGYDWFVKKAIPELNAYKDTKIIIINLGVNDYGNCEKYISKINEENIEWQKKGYLVYYMSVNPVDDVHYNFSITNADINQFNETMYTGLDKTIYWIDTNSYLQDTGFRTVDGLHYTEDTSRKIVEIFQSYLEKN